MKKSRLIIVYWCVVKEVQIYLYTLKISICLGVLEIEGNTRQCQ